ncbi:nuclear transport factor 2 family protein [[Actinomadura] parvosata]|uniref:nuclear transport factor 2 family protein n=1 Tax=[Actinomadura] parvosata TaxID=1955412 RepID=UPI00406D35AC
MTIRRLYELIDEGNVPALAGLFHPDAVYHRPGYAPLRGREEIARFYREDRVIREGAHTLGDIITDGDRTAVHGDFTGVLRDGTEVTHRFAEFFEHDPDGLLLRRETFFFIAHV